MFRRLLDLNGIAVLGAVLFHATGWGFTAMFWWTHRYRSVPVPNYDQIGTASYYGLRLVEQGVIVGVPIFLFVSGYFVAFAAGRTKKTIEWRAVGSRIWYLWIPYVIWSLVIFATEILQGDRGTIGEYAFRLLTGRATLAFYYVPMITQLYLLSPFLVRIAKWRWWPLLIVSAVAQLFVGSLIYLRMLDQVPSFLEPLLFLTRNWLFLSGLGWFSLGIVVGLQLRLFRSALFKAKSFLIVIVIVLFILGVIEWEILQGTNDGEFFATIITPLDTIFAACFIFMLLALENKALPFGSNIRDIGTKSYGIYLSHILVLEFTARVIAVTVPGLLAYQLIFLGILVAAGISIPILLMKIFNRQPTKIRRYYRYVFG